jgi:hypothetical protein
MAQVLTQEMLEHIATFDLPVQPAEPPPPPHLDEEHDASTSHSSTTPSPQPQYLGTGTPGYPPDFSPVQPDSPPPPPPYITPPAIKLYHTPPHSQSAPTSPIPSPLRSPSDYKTNSTMGELPRLEGAGSSLFNSLAAKDPGAVPKAKKR